MAEITVLYHGNCPDGHAAAFACWQVYGTSAQYLPVFYGQPPPDIPATHAVMLVDFSYARAVLEQLHARHGHVTVLDHHKSASEDLRLLASQHLPGLHIDFDLDECGATLTWKYLHGHASLKNAMGEDPPDMPRFFRYVRDRDLWQWQLPDSKAMSLAYWAIPKEMPAIAAFADALETDAGYAKTVQAGEAMQTYAEALVREQAARVQWGRFGGYLVPYVNTTTLFSEVGDALCASYEVPFAAYYFDRPQDRQWGLRSRRADVDCSLIAKEYGGGGHPGAAGFVTAHGWLPPTEGRSDGDHGYS